MIRKHMRLRLERLEEAMLPAESESAMRVEVYYGDPDGTEEFAYAVEVPRTRGNSPRPPVLHGKSSPWSIPLQGQSMEQPHIDDRQVTPEPSQEHPK